MRCSLAKLKSLLPTLKRLTRLHVFFFFLSFLPFFCVRSIFSRQKREKMPTKEWKIAEREKRERICDLHNAKQKEKLLIRESRVQSQIGRTRVLRFLLISLFFSFFTKKGERGGEFSTVTVAVPRSRYPAAFFPFPFPFPFLFPSIVFH